MHPTLYFASLLLTGALAGFLAFYAWRQRLVPGARAYMALSLCEFLLVLAEILSMLSPTATQALFWFRVRYAAIAFITVYWLLFALTYSGWQNLISKRLLAGLFIIPAITQVLLWTNNRFGLWVKHNVGFQQSGPFWLADVSARIPGPGFLAHSFYGLTLLLAGIALLLVTAWRLRRQFWGQALWLTGAGLIAFVFAVNSIFHLMPQAGFNLFTPGLGLSLLLIALAVFRFQFLKRAPAAGSDPKIQALTAQTQRSLAIILLIFIVMTAGLATLGYLSYQNYESQFRAQEENQLTAIAALKVNGLAAWRRERLGDAEILHQNPAFSALVQRYLDDPADAPAQAELQGWLDKYQSYGQYDRLILLDAAGAERMASPVTSEPATAYLINEAAAILRAGQVTFVDFHRDAAVGPIHLSLVVPLYGRPHNRPLGVLVLYIDPQVYLYPYLQQWPAPSASAETLLVRREGADVLFLNELKFQADSALSLRFPLTNTDLPAARAVLGQEGIVEGIDYRNEPVIAAVRAVPNSPWFLVARMDTAEVYTPLRERLWQTVAFFGALLAATGALLLLVWRQQRLRYYRGQVVAAEALRESESLLRVTAENYPNSYISIIEPDLTIGFTSGQEFKKKGLNSNDFVGLGLDQVFGEHTPLVKENYRKTFDGAETQFELFTNNQYQFYRTVPLLNQAGQVDRILAVVENITERKQAEAQILAAQAELQRLLAEANQSRRALLSVVEDHKQAEEALRESETRFSTIFRASPAAVALSRLSDSQLVDVNDAWQEITGYTRAEAIGQSTHELNLWANPNQRRQLVEVLDRQGTVRAEVKIHRKSGQVCDLLMSAELIELAGEGYLLTMGQDITERKQAEEKIRAALAEKEVLLREVHHRVKNNLQAVIALAEMRLDQVSDAATRLWLKEFQEQARTMSLVYEQLYQSDNLAQVDMLPYLQNLALNAFAAFGEGREIDLRLEVEPISLDVSAAMPCGLIVNELLTNALKHAFPPDFAGTKRVTVGLKAEGEMTILWVSNNGVNLPPDLDWRGGQSLGLRLVNLWATHQLGGRLEIDNRAGVTFKITLRERP